MSSPVARIDSDTVTSSNARPGIRAWISGARPRTLPLAFSPVILGSASAMWRDSFDPLLAGLALVVAIALQIGVNYANDYSDGVRGTDDHRVGPARLTGSGVVEPHLVKRAALVWFAVAALAGVGAIVISGSWWLLLLGALALIAAWTYTGGRKPYGYIGLGEVVVFVFFGLVATVGTAYIQIGEVAIETWWTGGAVGLFASTVLLENNLRDIEQDRLAHKRTLAVMIGPRGSRVAIITMLVVPYMIAGLFTPFFEWASLVFITAVLSSIIAVIVWKSQTPTDLILALQLTTLNSLLYSLVFGFAIAF